MAVLQVGLEQVGDVTSGLLAHAHPIAQPSEVSGAVASPHVEALRDHLGGQLVVAGERSRRDECRGRIEIGLREVELLVDPPDGVAELHTGVPQRIPDRAGDRLDLLGDLLRLDVVDEQQVEVALRGEFAAAVSADREQRHPAGRTRGLRDRLVEDGRDPVVGDLRERSAVVATRAIDDVGDLTEMPDPNRWGHGAMSAGTRIGARRSASTGVGATEVRVFPVEAIRRSYVTAPVAGRLLSYAGPQS